MVLVCNDKVMASILRDVTLDKSVCQMHKCKTKNEEIIRENKKL